MGPRVLSKVSEKSGIRYSLRALPIGGFVSMVGEDEASDAPGAFCRKPVWQRLIITASGAAMNLLLGVLLMSIMVGGSEALPTTTILRFADGASTEASGLRVGDRIHEINGVRVHIANDMVYEIMTECTAPTDVTVIRGGEKLIIRDVSFPTFSYEGRLYGTADFKVYSDAKTPLNLLKHAFWQSVGAVHQIWDSLLSLATGQYSIDDMSGPVGITEAIGEAAAEGKTDLLYLCAIITLNLGLVNLLPLPALDGGRIIFQLVELVRRKPVPPEIEGYVHFVGLVLLMLLMAVITYKDVVRLIK